MLNFSRLHFQKIIVHHITEKQSHQDSALATYENELFRIPERVDQKIKERLTDAAGRNSKAFELEIEATGIGSFFEIANQLHELDDDNFIEQSQRIADLLAHSQTRNRIPGGKLIIIDAKDTTTELETVIVIKAELHEAIQQHANSLSLLDNIFLSPAQKLFKIGVLYRKNDSEGANGFGCFIYDEQFRADSQPAEYFYKTFLGFTVSNNSKIQTQRFYDKTEKFIKANFEGTDKGRDLMKALKIEFVLSQENTVSPTDFANRFFRGQTKDSYISEVANELPGTIVKDTTLIDSHLTNRKLTFPNDIRVLGPETNFERNVKLVNNKREFEKLDFSDETYSIVRINGKPFLK